MNLHVVSRVVSRLKGFTCRNFKVYSIVYSQNFT